MQPQEPTQIRADLLRRTVLGLTDEECADALPWMRRWLANRDSGEPPLLAAVPLRRETDVLGREIVSVVVDDDDRIRMCRVVDSTRTPPSLQIGSGQNLFESLVSYPGRKTEEIRQIVAHVRQTRSHIEHECDSDYMPGERRLIRCSPGTRRGWVAICILAIPAVKAANGDDDELMVSTGMLLLPLFAGTPLWQLIASCLG
jgi:hypothetical protein